MLTFTRWKQIAILVTCLAGLLVVLPNFFPRSTLDRWPRWIPAKQLNLGLDLRGGEPEKLTAAEEGVIAFAWSPDGSRIAYTASSGRHDERKERDKRYGELERGDDRGHALLWWHAVGGARGKRLTDAARSVGDFSWSPDGKAIAFDHQIDDALRHAPAQRDVDAGEQVSVDRDDQRVRSGRVRWPTNAAQLRYPDLNLICRREVHGRKRDRFQSLAGPHLDRYNDAPDAREVVHCAGHQISPRSRRSTE